MDKTEPSIKTGKGDVDVKYFVSSVDGNKKLSDYLQEQKKVLGVNKDFVKDHDKVFADFQAKGYFNEQGELDESKALQRGNLRDIKRWSTQHPNHILEVADNGARRVYKRTPQYDDPGAIHVAKKLVFQDGRPDLQKNLEIAEDDRVLGIPYAQAMAGDRVYIINGKVFTGWSLYFSLSSIRSPEDYARNVDLAFNVPYLYGSLLLKAQLGLGTGFDVNYGSEENEVPEEKIIRDYLFGKLRINTQKLVKTGFHLGVYGNSYWALRRDKDGIVDKITILQPERLKIFLDPMTTKILFYIYLPPIIGGTTIASYPSDGRYNPNILTGTTLSYPTPIVMHPEDVCHFKLQDFTEYPFGFSDVKFCLDPATARMDVNILAPIIFKKYTKPMIHWILNTEGLGPNQIETKKEEMISVLEQMEPGSDPVTTDRWEAKPLDMTSGKNDIFALTKDMDTQIFAATGAPETYFKSEGSTDRMISEQDKTFLARLKVPQTIVGEAIEEQLIKPRIDHEIRIKKAVQKMMDEDDKLDEFLEEHGSYLAKTPKYPSVVWNEVFKQDETQSIANSIALLNSGVIDPARAATKVGEKPIAQQASEDLNKIGVDDKPKVQDPFAAYRIQQSPIEMNAVNNINPTPIENNEPANKEIPRMQEREDMENLRGGLNVTGKKDESNRNINDVEDPTFLGGSKYKKAKLVTQDDSTKYISNEDYEILFRKKK